MHNGLYFFILIIITRLVKTKKKNVNLSMVNEHFVGSIITFANFVNAIFSKHQEIICLSIKNKYKLIHRK